MIYVSKEFFDPEKICESGQVLLGWSLNEDGSYSVRSRDKRARVENGADYRDEPAVIISCPDHDNPFWSSYFDLQTDYAEIEAAAGKKDAYLRAALEYGRGIRMLRQDTFEALCSFIVSQNSNIPRIKKSISRIEEGLDHFPTPEELYERRSMLAFCGLGYRDQYLIRLAEELHEGRIDLDFPDDTNAAYEKLVRLHGIGPKVANCVLLFGLHRMERCPVDTWMKKIFNRHYGGEIPEWVSSPYAGYYQQAAFFYERSGAGEKNET